MYPKPFAPDALSLVTENQYVWSQRYIDSAVLRDENTGVNGLCDDERLYFLNDANFNVTALLDTAGDAVERYVYSPYGVDTIYDATWSNTRTESSYANVSLYTGRELAAETGLYYYRNRYYNAELGRFVSREPVGYEADANLYWYASNAPIAWSQCIRRAQPREDSSEESDSDDDVRRIERRMAVGAWGSCPYDVGLDTGSGLDLELRYSGLRNKAGFPPSTRRT